MNCKSMWTRLIALGFVFSFSFLSACYAGKNQVAVEDRDGGDQYKDWIILTFDYPNGKDVFSLRLPPGTEGIECENMRKQKGRILCGSSDEIWMKWKSSEIPNRVLRIGVESYRTDHMDLKQSLIAFNAASWKSDTIASFSKSYNGANLFFKDVVDSRFSEFEPIKRRRVASFETKNRFFANFSFAESETQKLGEKSIPQKEWKLEPFVEKILNSIVFAKDLGTPVELSK